MLVEALEGHRIWSAEYDAQPNPLLALETRVLLDRIGRLRDCAFLDVATGTGRWMRIAQSSGARAYGVDLCAEMLHCAAHKPGLAGRLALADACELPLRSSSIDCAVCSFAFGYMSEPRSAMHEMARVARSVIISDLHPEASVAGWTRGFRVAGRRYELQHRRYSERQLQGYAWEAGLVEEWKVEARFDEPERELFVRAGREQFFSELRQIPAILVTGWRRR
ncbi:MAG TPA: methyltransferase domain-containing protein [Bryobacteraceae bacterium]|nr:methyltransferase domain-containing protein [Bryobacteraceae bacterium]